MVGCAASPACCSPERRLCSTQKDLAGDSCPFASSSKMLQHLKDVSVVFHIPA